VINFYVSQNKTKRYEMNKVIINTLLVLLLMSCSFDFRSNKDMKSLIDSNNDKQLFLSFWLGMNEKDFKKVLQYENTQGNLKNGKFEFLYSSNTLVPLMVSQFGQGLELNYSNEYYDYWEGNGLQLPNSGLTKGTRYKFIIRELINTYNKKYELIKEDDDIHSSGFGYSDYYTSDYVWKAKMKNGDYKVIMLDSYVSYYTGKQGETFHRDKEEKRDKLASCRITIYYKSLKSYQTQLENMRKSKIESKNQELYKRQRDKDKIQNNRNKL